MTLVLYVWLVNVVVSALAALHAVTTEAHLLLKPNKINRKSAVEPRTFYGDF